MRADRSIIGKQYGYLTVLDLDHIDSGRVFWKCRCDMCNKEVVVRTDVIKTGKHGYCEHFKDVRKKLLAPKEITNFDYVLTNAIKAAKELGYSKECITELKVCKTEGEIERIMIKARHGGY